MKKLFLIPLLACFACVSAWAGVTDQAGLQAAINAAPAGASSATTITLDRDIPISDAGVCIYNRNILLDLAGHSITSTASKLSCIHLVLGKLEIKNGTIGTSGSKADAIMVYGSRQYKGDATDADKQKTHLIIDSDVTITASNNARGVHVYTYTNGKKYTVSDFTSSAWTEVSGTSTNYFSNTGLFRNMSSDDQAIAKTTATGQIGNSSAHGVAFGVTIDIYGKIDADRYGVQVSGLVSGGSASAFLGSCPEKRALSGSAKDGYTESFSDNHPYINIHEGASVIAVGDKQSDGTWPSAVYLAGYGHLKVEGSVLGNTGIFAKAGSLTISGEAEITASGVREEATESSSGSHGSGNAITCTNQGSYTSVTSILITGDPVVSASKGYALEENNVSTRPGDDQGISGDNVHVTGGTFLGSSEVGQDAIKTEDQVKTEIQANGGIVGGTFSGSEISEYLNTENAYIEQVEKDGETVYVLGAKPDDAVSTTTDAIAAGTTDEHSFVQVSGEHNMDIDSHVTMGYLSLADATNPSVFTIQDGGILEVGQVVLGEGNQIIVEAGGKLVITGNSGIVSFSADNLLIKAEAGKAGIFVLSPDVESNKSPYATVEYVSTARKYGSFYTFDMFASPFVAIDEIDNHSVPTNYQHIVNGAWTNTNKAGVISEAEPFQGFLITNNQENAFVTYTFAGRLQGNLTGHFALKQGFNYIGNGYMGNLDATKLLDALQASGADVYYGYYTYGPMSGYQSHTLNQGNLGVLPPMSGIILYANEDVEVDLNYEELIWNTNK